MLCGLSVLNYLNQFSEILKSPAFWGLIGVITGNLATHYFQHFREKQAVLRTSHANLYGIRRLLKQLYVSRFEAYLFSEYHEKIWINGGRVDQYQLDESLRWAEKSENLVIRIAEAESSLASLVGTYMYYVNKSSKVYPALDSLLHHQIPNIKSFPTNLTNAQLQIFRNAAHDTLIHTVDEIFDPVFLNAIEETRPK